MFVSWWCGWIGDRWVFEERILIERLVIFQQRGLSDATLEHG
jgi:hypothetical protein